MLLGLEISRHDCAAILAKDDGAAHLALRQELPQNQGAAAQWLAAMELCRSLFIRAALDSRQIGCAGVSFVGDLDAHGTVVKSRRAPGWNGYELPRAMREHLGIAHSLAVPRAWSEGLGEAQFGALQGEKNWLYLHLGREIEAAAMLGGQLVRGARNAGVDIGGIVIERDGSLGSSGQRGTLEAYCGREAFLSGASSYGLAFEQAHQIWGLTGQNFAAQSLVESFTARLGQGLGAALSLLNPAQICIGGAFGRAIFDKLRPALETKLRELAPARAVENLQIISAQLGDDAAALGAVALALNENF